MQPSPPRVSLGERALALVLLAGSGGVLAVAWQLTPDQSGMGTHRQLGLGECTLLALTGWPCPTCGMTTTFALGIRGRLLEAFVTQPFGLVLFLCTVAVALVSLLDLVHPTRRLMRFWGWLAPREGWAAAFLMLGLLAGWLYKLAVHFSG